MTVFDGPDIDYDSEGEDFGDEANEAIAELTQKLEKAQTQLVKLDAMMSLSRVYVLSRWIDKQSEAREVHTSLEAAMFSVHIKASDWEEHDSHGHCWLAQGWLIDEVRFVLAEKKEEKPVLLGYYEAGVGGMLTLQGGHATQSLEPNNCTHIGPDQRPCMLPAGHEGNCATTVGALIAAPK
jgi:hypothetical protein